VEDRGLSGGDASQAGARRQFSDPNAGRCAYRSPDRLLKISWLPPDLTQLSPKAHHMHLVVRAPRSINVSRHELFATKFSSPGGGEIRG
jgi:hypothetical protein